MIYYKMPRQYPDRIYDFPLIYGLPNSEINTRSSNLMSAYYSDTHPKMEALQIRLLREAPPWRKMEMLAGLNASTKALVLSGLRQRHPQASEGELRRRLAGLSSVCSMSCLNSLRTAAI